MLEVPSDAALFLSCFGSIPSAAHIAGNGFPSSRYRRLTLLEMVFRRPDPLLELTARRLALYMEEARGRAL